MKHTIITLFTIMSFTQTVIAQSTGTFTDMRDGQTYKTINIESDLPGSTVTWMAQNLNYKMQDSFACDDNESYRKEKGLLYTWEAAKNACPSGWHLPMASEWSLLVNEFGGIDKAGEPLKSREGWIENGNGTNSSGFSALPGGIRKQDGSYIALGGVGYWWSCSPANKGRAWEWNMHFADSNKLKVFRFDGDVSVGLSVRCVLN